MRIARCPFCGGKGVLQDEGDQWEHSYRVECANDCGFNVMPPPEGDGGYTKSGAIHAWNYTVSEAKKLLCPKCGNRKIKLGWVSGVACGKCSRYEHLIDDEDWTEMFDRFNGKEAQ